MNEKSLIHSKMIAVLRGFDAIKKDSKNQQQNFMFRGIDAFMNEAHRLFAEHGIFITIETLHFSQSERATKSGGVMYASQVGIKYTFHAEDGSSVSSTMDSEAVDSGDKGVNKCYAIALKYCLMQTFMVPTEDMKDPDAETAPETAKRQPVKPVPATPEQIGEIKKILDTKPPLNDNGLSSIAEAINTGMTSEQAGKSLKWLKDGIKKLEAEIK